MRGIEAHHKGDHRIFIGYDAGIGISLVIAYAAVTAETVCNRLGHVGNNKVEGSMCEAECFITQSDRKLIHPMGDEQIAHHPAIAEEAFYVPGNHNEPAKNRHQVEPAGIIIEGILHSAPFAAGTHLQLFIIDLTWRLFSGTLDRIDDLLNCLHAFPPL